MEHEQLLREVRWLRRFVVVLTLAFLVMGAKSPPQRFEEVSVRRLNVVDADGSTRLVLAGQDDFPLPILDGKTYSRQVSPAGIVFYNRKGNEVGGLALTDVEAGKVSALAFDYPTVDAIALVTRMGPDGKPISSGLEVAQQVPLGLSVAESGKLSACRIAIQNKENDAEILLSDSRGRNRIRLRVDKADQACMEILDPEGKVIFRAP